VSTSIIYRETRDLPRDQVIALYESVHWSSAKKPDTLLRALASSHTLISAWDGARLVGLGNAISDGHLVVYYPHLVVHPEYQGRGIGREIVHRMQERYSGFHQQSLIADGGAVEFYKKCGFVRAGRTEPMWIFAGDEH
jgi:GNAT superfamily N-acetyltransferase